ncbi:MAG: DUF4328 domain-containing protein [Polyangiaceae bacterium]|nr:DUF4328 domain-containing protein [Polyangiaceae bacterium]
MAEQSSALVGGDGTWTVGRVGSAVLAAKVPERHLVLSLAAALVTSGALVVAFALHRFTDLRVPAVWLMLVPPAVQAAWFRAASRLSLESGAEPVSISRAGAFFGLLIPVVNLIYPFAVVRRLVRASRTDDLPELHTTRVALEGYRGRREERRVLAPKGPAAPLVVVWQLVEVSRLGAVWLLPDALPFLQLGALALQLYVLHAVTRRLRARVAYLRQLAAETVTASDA